MASAITAAVFHRQARIDENILFLIHLLQRTRGVSDPCINDIPLSIGSDTGGAKQLPKGVTIAAKKPAVRTKLGVDVAWRWAVPLAVQSDEFTTADGNVQGMSHLITNSDCPLIIHQTQSQSSTGTFQKVEIFLLSGQRQFILAFSAEI